MWQVEDLLRANDLDMGLIQQRVIGSYPSLDEAARNELAGWYEGLIAMMRREGVEKEGHLQINTNTLSALTDLHLRLLQSPAQPYYAAAYYKALPFLVEFRGKSDGMEKPEVENALDALYGVWMLKLQKRPISAPTATAVEEISQWISQLSRLYKEDEEGTLEL